MSDLPSVNSADLHAALRAASAKLNQYQQTLNHISADIRAIESYLKQKNITFPYTYMISEDLANVTISEDLDFGVQVDGTKHRELLTWEDEDGSGFRLRYVVTRQEDVTQDGKGRIIPSGQEGPIEVLERRPLIECKTEIRVKSYDHLHKFITGLSTSIPNPTDAQDIAELNDIAPNKVVV